MQYDYPQLNQDEATRDTLIFGEHDPQAYSGGIRRFEGLSLNKLKKLLELKFIDPEERQNYSPTTAEILRFMKRYPAYKAHGYVVTIDRSDYRVTLEGVSKEDFADSDKELMDFTELFKHADEFDPVYMYCWYD